MNSQIIYVLLVEDDIDYSALLRRRLMGSLNQNSELTFVVAQTGFLHEAVEYATTNTVDVVVLDLNLPDAMGMETLARMREAVPHAAVIVLTGRDDQELAAQAIRMGAQDYLSKGHFDTELLVRTIRYAIDRKQSEQALSQAKAKLRSMNSHKTIEKTTTEKRSVETKQDLLATSSVSHNNGSSGQNQNTSHAITAESLVDSYDIASDFDTLLGHMATQNSLALAQLGNDNPARVHVEKLNQTINLAASLTKRLFNGLRGTV
jgi:DNA-binding NarL/FixJ family response regulator